MNAKSILINLIRRSNYALPPHKIAVEITQDCNLNCPMCPRQFNKITGENMSVEKFRHILDQLPMLRYVHIIGQGEPFMHPNIFEILNLGKARNIHFILVTNGILLTEENIKRLTNISVVEASIDCPDPQGYKKIRGANLELILNNLKKLKQLKKDVYLRIQAIIMEDNIEDLPDFINLVKNTNADEIRLFYLISFAQNTDRWKSERFKNLNTKLRLTKDLAKRERVKLVATPLLEKPRLCTEPWFQPRITLNGDIYPCCYMYITSQPTWQEWYYGVCLNVPQFKYKMGNIFKDSFKKIWNGSDYRLLRETVRKLDDPSLLLPEEINQRRKKIDLKGKFPYCKVCLFKQNCAC